MSILIVYTTRYRKGSPVFARIAETLRRETKERYNGEVICKGIVGKRELTDLFTQFHAENRLLDEFHFIGHAGMYGPMFGTVEYPEQYSPYEWKQLPLPFSPEGKAYFHCCRSARWFASFFAQISGVTTYGA